jgi:hypothetical protein
MYLRPGENVQVARLMGFLLAAECLATNIAQHQVRLAPDAKSRRFLIQQARQERVHAAVFHRARRWLAPRASDTPPALVAVSRYESLAQAALARGDFDESVVALQVVLEGLGDVVLHNVDAGLSRRGLGFARLRRMLRQQEQTHHAFGAHLFQRRIELGATDSEGLRSRAERYFELVDTMLAQLADLFVAFDEDPARYRAAFLQTLPTWLPAL